MACACIHIHKGQTINRISLTFVLPNIVDPPALKARLWRGEINLNIPPFAFAIFNFNINATKPTIAF